MLAFKAPAYVSAIATLVLVAASLFSVLSSHQLAVNPWLSFAFTTLFNFVVIFLVGLLPMPAAVLCRRLLPTMHVVVRFALSLAFGALMVFLILRLVETPTYEPDGMGGGVYRHAGPSVNASTKLTYYLYAAPILVFSLVIYQWLERAAARANKSMQPTCEDARG